ncbi:hypothetical protein [Nostocoides sp. HKS02]|uniref:hypothetical protein n=1 Tax=Nostocoides sp. HKS02 TaxID=1813880 RepID=UPI0012B47E71|nr:hypothetical protein [Tetrasphaera sp. HKS02]QGN57787.1 hypothetical protein GKE56_07755 [Tetrasphaera sp. HKS02]
MSKPTCHGKGSKPCPSPTSTTSTTTTSTTSSSTTSSSTTSSSTTTGPATWACTAPLGGGCGAYRYAGIPNSNGYNTYVSNQAVGAQTGTSQVVQANSPGDWQVVANDVPYGYTGVQTFPDAQQLFNNWCGNGWGGCSADTPVNSLSALKVVYAESSPQDALSLYQYSPDVWLDNYGSDIMFWVDVHGRCNEGAFGGTVLGHAVIDGQNWTVHRYGGFGAEIIFVLDGTGGTGTCAQQTSGTINIKAGIDWLTANRFITGAPVMSQLNTGWEITSADNTTFRVSSYSIIATPL